MSDFPLVIFECWRSLSTQYLTVTTPALAQRMKLYGDLDEDAEAIYSIKAATWEEALSVHHDIQGWTPYVPMKERNKT